MTSSAKAVVYGVTAGFGSHQCQHLAEDDSTARKPNPYTLFRLWRSCWCSPGRIIESIPWSRAILVPVSLLSRNFWNCSIKALSPIPEKGSLGASGDLAPLAHGSAYAGTGPRYQGGALWTEALDKAGIEKIAPSNQGAGTD